MKVDTRVHRPLFSMSGEWKNSKSKVWKNSKSEGNGGGGNRKYINLEENISLKFGEEPEIWRKTRRECTIPWRSSDVLLYYLSCHVLESNW